MAIIFGVYDPSSSRRKAVDSAIPASISDLTHLHSRKFDLDKLVVYIKAPNSTPISIHSKETSVGKATALVVGDFGESPLNGHAAETIVHACLSDLEGPRTLAGQDGFYLALFYDGHAEISLGTDALGMFPLYFWARDDVLLFGTSPELFKHHPLFAIAPDPFGVASVLLLSHISCGRTLYKNVFRGTPGKYLSWNATTGTQEKSGNPITLSENIFNSSYRDTRDSISSLFDEYSKNLSIATNGKIGMLLSGGQDSRLIAGYLGKSYSPENVCAISIGGGEDQELAYAKAVASRLHWRHQYDDIEPDSFLSFSETQIDLESLQGPFASFHNNTAIELLAKNTDSICSGYFGDLVMGDRHILAAQDPKSGEFSFSALFRRINAYGFSANEVALLLGEEEGSDGSVAMEVIASLESQWNCIEGHNFQKAWLFQALNRQRFHIGSIAWRLSLGAWHRVPYLSRLLLDTVSGMPLNFFAQRRIQADIIVKNFPDLARIPLDRNSGEPGYLVKGHARKFIDGLPSLSDVSWRLHKFFKKDRENRYYFRVYDFNGKGWKAIREKADDCRESSSTLFQRRQLDLLLPSATQNVEFHDGIIESSKLKSVVGLLLWSAVQDRNRPTSAVLG